jgi:hypothetical protein
LRVVDLQNVSYHDDPWVLASHVAQVFYMPDPHSMLPPKKRKQHIIRFDGVDDVEAYNNYDEMLLFTNFTKKISVVEKTCPKTHCHENEKVSRESCYGGGLTSLCKCVFVRLHLCMCVRLD